MDKIVPLHSLVIVISNRSHEIYFDVKSVFQRHEIISVEEVKRDLVGTGEYPELDAVARTELYHRIALKLSLGERVVVIGSYMKKERRSSLVNIATIQGAPVFFLIDDTEDAFEHSNVISGDGTAEVLYLKKHNLKPTIPLPEYPSASLRSRFRGITVVGDVHANLRGLESAVSWASDRNHFLWFLGDVVDYGDYPIETLELVHDLLVNGQGAVVLGNHERKIARYLQNQQDGSDRNLRLSSGNYVTINALNALPDVRRKQWCGKFKSILSRSTLISHVDNVTLAHGAIHPSIWDCVEHGDIENYALYGQSQGHINKGDFKLIYDWVDHVPKDSLVLVGHDRRSSTCPLATVGKLGGKVVFMDTGSGKGGALSTADLRFDDEGLTLENFNLHA